MVHQVGDDTLITAAQQGNPGAFTQLVQRHWTWVYRLIAAIVRDHAAAEDVTQEVFCQVYQHLGDYTAQGKFVAWLKRIAVNRARNFLRDHGRKGGREGRLPQGEVASDELADPATVIASHLLHQEVRAALQSLPEEQRHVLIRHYFGGQSIETIAEALACPIGTVKSRLFHARRHLRQLLRSEWAGDDEQGIERKEQL